MVLIDISCIIIHNLSTSGSSLRTRLYNLSDRIFSRDTNEPVYSFFALIVSQYREYEYRLLTDG